MMTVCLAHRRNRTRTQALCVLYSMFFPLYHSYRTCGRRTLVISSVQFSLSVMSNSLQYHRLQHNRPPCPSPTSGTYSNSWPLSPWYHTTIPSSVVPFSSCLQSFPASGSFQMSQFASVGQSIGVSASASVFPKKTQDWSLLGWTGWISLQSKGISGVFFNSSPQFKRINSSVLSFLYSPTHTSVLSFLYSPTHTSIHDHWKNLGFY